MRKASDSERNTKGKFTFPSLGTPQQLWVLTLLLLLGCGSAEVKSVTGKAYVTDGDTIRISGERIRLEGIDAPERNQRCRDASGKSYGCGLVSTAALRNKIERSSIKCEGTKRDRYGRFLGICYLNGLDLNGWMVRNGHALAYRRYSRLYVSAERKARENGRGLWAGEFVAPWSWRRGERLTNSSPHPGK